MNKLYLIQQVCELTSVSTRTLHFYDEKNILKPSHRTSKGHRLYSQNDLLQLQQILTFKFLGFSLKQIKQLIHHKADIAQSLKMQADAVLEEFSRIEKVKNFLNYFINEYDNKNTMDWEVIAKMLLVFKQKKEDSKQWLQKYLTPLDLDQVNKFMKTRNNKWLTLFNEIREITIHNPTATPDETILEKWHALADEAYGNNPKLKEKLWQAYKAGMIPNDFFPYDKSVIDYLSKGYKPSEKKE